MTFLSLFSPCARRRGAVALLALGTGLATTACDLSDPGVSGDLGRGTFYYECDNNPDDGFCDRDVLDREFPAAVAVGAMFRVDYEPNGSGYFDLVSGCLDCMERTPEGFTMPRAGRGPLLVENADEEIFDILHIEAKDAADLVIRANGEPWPDGELVLQPAARVDFNATPQAADGTELGGALPYTWEIADETVIRSLTSTERNDLEVAAVGPGETTITIKTGDVTVEIPVRVEGN